MKKQQKNESETMVRLRKQIRSCILEARGSDKSPQSMGDQVVAIVELARDGLKHLEQFKAKVSMPTRKAESAVTSPLQALDALFNDMMRTPLNYLDAHPQDVVAQHHSRLDAREKSLVDGTEKAPEAPVQETVYTEKGKTEKEIQKERGRVWKDSNDVGPSSRALRSTVTPPGADSKDAKPRK